MHGIICIGLYDRIINDIKKSESAVILGLDKEWIIDIVEVHGCTYRGFMSIRIYLRNLSLQYMVIC